MKRYLREKEVSERAGIALQTLRNWRHQRRGFPYIKISRNIFYDPDDVEMYMQERKIVPEACGSIGSNEGAVR